MQESSPSGADFVRFVLIVLARSIRIINQFERGVVYCLGRVLEESKLVAAQGELAAATALREAADTPSS